MKKISFLALALLLLGSCATEEPQKEKEMVDVTLSYMFAESGDMARSTSSDAYSTFYNNQIKTKKLTPQHYNLTFTDTNGATIKMESYWNKNSKFSILEGEYTVTGISAPTTETIDTLYMSFNEKITISKENPNITLTALNDCYLLLFNAENIKEIRLTKTNPWGTKEYQVKKMDNLFFVFNQYFNANYYKNTVELYNTDGSESIIEVAPIPFVKGKYYYFNEITNSFDVPAMEEGN